MKSCECYDVQADQWKQLPDFPHHISNSSVCEFVNKDQKYLYSFGGIAEFGSNDERKIDNTICRLKLSGDSSNTWEVLDTKLHFAGCDLGSFQL